MTLLHPRGPVPSNLSTLAVFACRRARCSRCGRAGLGRADVRSDTGTDSSSDVGLGKRRDGRAGELVLESTVKHLGSEDARVGRRVRAGETGGRGDSARACAAGDAELEAAGVELGAAFGVCEVQSDDLVTHNVVAVCDGLGNRDLVRRASHYNQNISTSLKPVQNWTHSA
jgi:hypothetical protein